jgi:uncharacterized glyoxalase superfamily protein PhnB
MAQAVFNKVNLVVRDMDAALAFYRLVGLDLPEAAVWRTASGAHHARAATDGAADLELDSQALGRRYNEGFGAERANAILGVSLGSREAVDEAYGRLIAEGHQGLQPPYDAFWGARYAIVEDPDGNPVGLMSPPDPARRTPPPAI